MSTVSDGLQTGFRSSNASWGRFSLYSIIQQWIASRLAVMAFMERARFTWRRAPLASSLTTGLTTRDRKSSCKKRIQVPSSDTGRRDWWRTASGNQVAESTRLWTFRCNVINSKPAFAPKPGKIYIDRDPTLGVDKICKSFFSGANHAAD